MLCLASAQTGRHNEKRVSYGDAMIVDPWGTVRARGGSTTKIVSRGCRSQTPAADEINAQVVTSQADIYRSKVIMSNI